MFGVIMHHSAMEQILEQHAACLLAKAGCTMLAMGNTRRTLCTSKMQMVVLSCDDHVHHAWLTDEQALSSL